MDKFSVFVDYFLDDISSCGVFLLDLFYDLYYTLFDDWRYSWLFYLGFLPSLLMLIIDIVFSFLFSFRLKKLVFFNVVSPKSWSLFSKNQNFPRETTLKYSRLSPIGVKVLTKFHILKKKNNKILVWDSKGLHYRDVSKNSNKDLKNTKSKNIYSDLRNVKLHQASAEELKKLEQKFIREQNAAIQKSIRKEFAFISRKYPSINISVDDNKIGKEHD